MADTRKLRRQKRQKEREGHWQKKRAEEEERVQREANPKSDESDFRSQEHKNTEHRKENPVIKL